MSKWTLIRPDKYKHYQNRTEAGMVFCTFTVLDFVHAFAEKQIASLMVASLLNDCLVYGANLFSFVVMPHHVHLLVTLPEGHGASWLIARIKSNSALRILPRLSQVALDQFDMQRGLNNRSFWQRSFRSIQIESREMASQKMDYIHMNPVKAGLVSSPELYHWSSYRLILEGLGDAGTGLRIDKSLIERFAATELLSVWHRR